MNSRDAMDCVCNVGLAWAAESNAGMARKSTFFQSRRHNEKQNPAAL